MMNNPAVMLYKQINRNLNIIKTDDKKPSMGLLSSNRPKQNSSYDKTKPIVRSMKHMEVLRNQREEIRNGK